MTCTHALNRYWMRFLWYAEKSRSGRPRPWLFRVSQEPNPIIDFIIQCLKKIRTKNTEPCFNGCVPNAPAIVDKIKWNSKPPSPPRQGWRRAKGKNAPFSHPWFGGKGGSRFSIYFVQDCNLGQNKMEQQTPIPPRQGWRRAKDKNAPFSHPWFGGEGVSRFSIYFVQDCGSCDSVIALGNHALS